jgi:hypothetical protein
MKSFLIFLLLYIPLALLGQESRFFDASYFTKENLVPPIRLGKGFNINDLYANTKDCFLNIDPNNLTSLQMGGRKTSIRIYYTKNNEDYNQFKSIGVSGSMNYLNLYSMGGKKLDSYMIQSNQEQERIIFYANVDFGLFELKNDLMLNEEAQKLINEKNTAEFIKQYGTHYITSVRKESNIQVILTKTSRKQGYNEQTNNSLELGANVPLKGSGSMEIESNEWISQQLEENNFSVQIEINGPSISQGNLKGQVSSILSGSESNKSEAISKLIDGAFENIYNEHQSIITQYYYGSFSNYGLKNIYWDDKKITKLGNINKNIIKVFSDKNRMKIATEKLKATCNYIEQYLYSEKISQSTINIYRAKYDELLNMVRDREQKGYEFLNNLEKKYLSCADIYCPTDDICCNINLYFAQIENYYTNQDNLLINKIKIISEEVVNEIKTVPECQRKGMGIIHIRNVSSNPYDVYNGNEYLLTVPEGKVITINLLLGYYSLKAIQRSGYMMYPTENYRNISVSTQCETYSITIGTTK